MKNYLGSINWGSSVYLRWTVFPIIAHIVSWMTGIMGLLLFPILITIAQYSFFKIHPAINRAGPWFFTLPITFFIWLKWGPAVTGTQTHDIVPGVIAYYVGQLINTLYIPLLVKQERGEIILKWLGSNIVTLIIWVISYRSLLLLTSDWNDVRSFSFSVILTVYPVIGLIANGISGLFWRKDLCPH